MSDRFAVLVNGEVMLEYDRARALAPAQLEYLNKMDQKMDHGIDYNGQHYATPDQTVRAQFVTMNLIQALLNDDEQRMAAMCSWLALRIPELKQVQAVTQNDTFTADLVFDKAYEGQQQVASQVKVEFNPKLN